MFEQIDDLVREHADLETQLADPSIHADQGAARRLGRRFAELSPLVSTYREWLAVGADLDTARELSGEDSTFVAEAADLTARREQLAEELHPPAGPA